MELDSAIRRCLTQAEDDLFQYSRVCFAHDLLMDSLVVVSAAGPYWRWILVKRADVAKKAADFQVQSQFLERFTNVLYRELGSEDSDKELNALLLDTLIPFLENHHTYPMISSNQV